MKTKFSSISKHFRLFLGACIVICCLVAARTWQREQRLSAFFIPLTFECSVPNVQPGSPEAKALLERKTKFNVLWLSRSEAPADVWSQEVKTFLDDPDETIRGSAVRALAFSENADSETRLASLLQSRPSTRGQNKASNFEAVELKLALARIRSRQLSAAKKVNALLESVGLSFSDMVALSAKINAKHSAYDTLTPNQAGRAVMTHFIELLCSLQRRGEDVKPWSQKLTLGEIEKMRLAAASLPSEQEANTILEYICDLQVLTADTQQLSAAFFSLDFDSKKVLWKKLQDMTQNPQDYYGLKPIPGKPGRFTSRNGYNVLFEMVGSIGDEKALPYLEKMVDVPDLEFRNSVQGAIKMIKAKRTFQLLV